MLNFIFSRNIKLNIAYDISDGAIFVNRYKRDDYHLLRMMLRVWPKIITRFFYTKGGTGPDQEPCTGLMMYVKPSYLTDTAGYQIFYKCSFSEYRKKLSI